jgi:hypothetical protein
MNRSAPIPRPPVARWLGFAAAASFVAVGCGIATDDSPRDIEPRAATPVAQTAAAAAASGADRIFLVAPGLPDRLEAVARDIGDDPLAVVEAVLAGPSTDEVDDGYRSMLPASLAVNQVEVRDGGVLAIDLSAVIGDVAADDLSLALAQLVFSIDRLPDISSALITVDGQERRWPAGDGELLSGPLTVYDYPGLVESNVPVSPPGTATED